MFWSDDHDHCDGEGCECRGRGGGRSEDSREWSRGQCVARHRADADRRDRRRAQARAGNVRPDARRRKVDAHRQAVQDGCPRMAQGEYRHRCGRHPDRRQHRAGHRRPLLGRDPAADGCRRRRRARRRRAADARRRVQAAHVAICVPGQRCGGPETSQGRRGQLQAAGRHRIDGRADARRFSSTRSTSSRSARATCRTSTC